jgi:hypothetical protein
VRCHDKGRRSGAPSLRKATVAVLHTWLRKALVIRPIRFSQTLEVASSAPTVSNTSPRSTSRWAANDVLL